MSGRMIDLPASGAMLLTAPAGCICQSLDHPGHEVPPASTIVSVAIMAGIVSDVYLCGPCTDRLLAATVSAGG